MYPMKKKAIHELKTKPGAELLKLLQESKERLRVLRFDLAAGKVKNIVELREAKKLIARLQTFLRMRERNDEKK
ncbi:MAG: 50S ribosomal protein L29 [Candidatus Liptonbacteria bacterium]|nr:50S ribosomal protein L29 [Candidatus Liptonbacteria bacterium]